MSKNKFVGVAYWTLSTLTKDWLSQALKVLSVLETAGLATMLYDCLPAGDQMTVVIGDDQFLLLVNNGQGRGVVRASPSASCFILCLVALRKALGDITVVTDSQQTVPTLPRQSDPLYSSDWLRIQPVAQQLGLICDDAFITRHTSVFTNVF